MVWTQGCPLACPGCWNRDTWSFAKRQVVAVDALLGQIHATAGIEGVTFTGGEPFAQALSLAAVARAVRAAGLTVFVFSGYDLDEIQTSNERKVLLEHVDVLVAGRYVAEQRDLELPWRGSRNQQVHFLSERYGATDMLGAASVEVHIGADGAVTLTGFPSDNFRGLNSYE